MFEVELIEFMANHYLDLCSINKLSKQLKWNIYYAKWKLYQQMSKSDILHFHLYKKL